MAEIDKNPQFKDVAASDENANASAKQATERKSDSGAGLVDQAHGDLAADAAAYLERSGYTLQSLGGSQ